MSGGTGIDQKILIRGRPYSFPHGGQAIDELRDRKFELTGEHTARRRDGESGTIRARRQRQGEIGDQQRLAHLGFSADKQNPLRRQQSGFYQTGRRTGGLLFQKLRQRQHSAGGFLRGHSIASVVASSRMASSTRDALREAARRKAVKASLLTLRRMPLVA